MASAERDYVQAHRQELVDDLVEWLRIPSISANRRHHPDVVRSAEWWADALRRSGFPTAEVWPTPGCPAVYGEWPSDDPDAPVVLIYGHHDVQPVEPTSDWDSDPFDPVLDADLLRARGASDDKGQLVFHLLGVRAHLAATGRSSPAVTLKVLVEGEEESGSPHFEELLRARRSRLDCDVTVITDPGMVSEEIATTVTGMRGMIACTVLFRGPSLDLHSGHFGGAVPNPATCIGRLVGALHHDDNSVAIPGFYADVVDFATVDRDRYEAAGVTDQQFLGFAKSTAVSGEPGFAPHEQIGFRPTAEVNALRAGYQGSGVKTVIPSEASVSLSFRLVPHQDRHTVRSQVEEFVRANTPPGISSTVTWQGDGVAPFVVSLESAAYGALETALGRAFDSPVVAPTRAGGSGPEGALAEVLGRPMVSLATGSPTDQIHAPNERVSISRLLRGAEAAAILWAELARIGRTGLAPAATS